MAWRALTKKGICASLTKALSVSSRDSIVSVSKCGDATRAVSASVRYLHGHCYTAAFQGGGGNQVSANRQFVRCFHATPELLAKKNDRRGDDDSFGVSTSRWKRPQKGNNGKFSKRKKETQPPVETPYMPPRLLRAAKSLPDKTIEIFDGMTILELAKRCEVSKETILDIFFHVEEKAASEFDAINVDTAELIAMEVGVDARRVYTEEGSQILPRSPVVTVMGHVDHGKTSLLDALRQTSLAAKEAGGITQHVGAFVVGMPSGASITFLDTPGHAAFSAMRARGAAVTDVVVLVVAADDGVMPQTREAMAHAQAANVPIVVAINKCDKTDANPEKVKDQLASEGLLLEDTGGDVQVVEVSAITKTGLDKLEDALLLQAELMDLKARIDGPAQAYVVEARVDKGRGPLVTAIIKAGTLVCGKHVVIGAQWGKIRSIRDMAGKTIAKATPAMPVEIEGLKGLPMAGDDIVVVDSEEIARMLSEGRRQKIQKDRLMKIEEERRNIEEQEQKNLIDEEENEDAEEKLKRVDVPIVVKGDVQGTVQAVTDALKFLDSPQVIVKVVHAGVGPVTQSDVDLAQACSACIVGFNVRDPPASITLSASQAKVQIKSHRIIYHLLEDIGNLIVEKAPGTLETKVAGEAEVLSIFELKGRSKAKGDDVKIAGCRVIDGRVTKTATLRLLRSGETVFEGCCSSLKREQQDVEAVGKGNECGLVMKDFMDFRVGDVIQCLVKVKRKPKYIASENGAARIEC